MNLNQVTIPVTNVPKSIEFYKSLGLKLIVHTHDGYARFECSPGGSTLSLHKVEKMGVGPRTTIYFEREDLDEYVGILIDRGVSFVKSPREERWLWREAECEDLDGNPIIIYKAGDNRINPPWKIKEE